MIIGIGTDIVDERRIERMLERFGQRFLQRIFTRQEQLQADAASRPASYLAKRFAAKVAVYKALDRAGVAGLGWRDAEITNTPRGAPCIRLAGKCRTALERLTPDGYKATVDISISDEPPYAMAFVVVWADRAESARKETVQ